MDYVLNQNLMCCWSLWFNINSKYQHCINIDKHKSKANWNKQAEGMIENVLFCVQVDKLLCKYTDFGHVRQNDNIYMVKKTFILNAFKVMAEETCTSFPTVLFVLIFVNGKRQWEKNTSGGSQHSLRALCICKFNFTFHFIFCRNAKCHQQGWVTLHSKCIFSLTLFVFCAPLWHTDFSRG